MSSVLTNRLIGSAILIVAAIVFLPDLLDGQKQVRKDDFKAVPERPEFAEVPRRRLLMRISIKQRSNKRKPCRWRINPPWMALARIRNLRP